MQKEIITEEQLEQLKTLIKESETIICVCHQNPDGDALGSTLGWADVLKTSFGKEPQVIEIGRAHV